MLTKNKKLAGAIIAGGRGSRFNPVSLTTPKALLPICNKPIIIHQIEFLKGLGIGEIFVVVGYLKEQIIDLLGNGSRLGVKITYIVQEEPEGSGHAVGLLEPFLETNFVLFLGDISIKIKRNVSYGRQICRANSEDLTLLACKTEDDIERLRQNFAIILEPDGRVKRVLEKPDEPPTRLKGCGVYLFTPKIFKAIKQTPRSGKRNEYELTNAIQTLINMKQPVYPIEIVDWDVNISSAQELYRCNYLWFKDMKVKNLIGEGCMINPKASLENCILGDRVRIENPVTIKDSLIFPNSQVYSKSGIRGMVITPLHEIQIGGGQVG